MIAALYVQTDGCYFDIEGVDPWDEARDARTYVGPHPVVAHPPCERWGRYWFGGPSVKVRRVLGDDGGCFVAALEAVRKFGGVLEHPEGSHAWKAHLLHRPPKWGGWVVADDVGGWTCCVEQGHYGHRARKATWLYAHGADLPSLAKSRSAATMRMDEGFHTTAERRAARAAGIKPPKRLPDRERAATPIPFRDMLLSIARSAA